MCILNFVMFTVSYSEVAFDVVEHVDFYCKRNLGVLYV